MKDGLYLVSLTVTIRSISPKIISFHFIMRPLVLTLILCSLSSGYISSTFGSFLTEKSCGERCSIATKVLLNFITEYATNETKFLSFIVSKDVKTPFQKEILDHLYHDPTLSNYPYHALYSLNNNDTQHRQQSFNII